MPRLTLKRLMIAIAIISMPMAWACLAYRGSRIIEELKDPHQVLGWTSAGLILDDRRTVPLPSIGRLPADSKVLGNAIVRGVEVTADGRVIGLLPCRRSCGRDPIRERILRVDIADLMIFLKEVDFPIPTELEDPEWSSVRGRSLDRWDIGEFMEFRLFVDLLRRSKQGR